MPPSITYWHRVTDGRGLLAAIGGDFHQQPLAISHPYQRRRRAVNLDDSDRSGVAAG